MAALIFYIISSSGLGLLGIYHLISTTKNYLKSPPRDYISKPFHPFTSAPPRFKHIQLYLVLFYLVLSIIHQTLIAFDADPLLKGRTPVHFFTSLQYSCTLCCFVVLAVSILLSETTSLLPNPFPNDVVFGVLSALFFIQFNVASTAATVQTSDLQAKCDSVFANISLFKSFLCLILACVPRLFVADVGLGGAFLLQGLWVLQTGLSLYVEAFIPEGCHKLLDVVNGVEGSTKCDLEDSKLRAVAILDLVFVVHVLVVLVVVFVVYAIVGKSVGVNKRLGSYEALPNASHDSNHIQMKAMLGSQA
ncbi:hypothetical protein Leryth_009273 [Lithospermum erythrorhizon]|nr:hypothetical protein Leryth_009273 [Lithospermum erythrorhizon]